MQHPVSSCSRKQSRQFRLTEEQRAKRDLPVPTVLPCGLFCCWTSSDWCSSWYSIRNCQSVRQQTLLILAMSLVETVHQSSFFFRMKAFGDSLDDTLYLILDGIPNLSKRLSRRLQFTPETFWIPIDTELVVRHSVPEMESGRDGQVGFEDQRELRN